jgi:solute carrier family 25 S-adenosylmethionine transporter 26
MPGKARAREHGSRSPVTIQYGSCVFLFLAARVVSGGKGPSLGHELYPWHFRGGGVKTTTKCYPIPRVPVHPAPSLSYTLRVGLAGGIAGAVGTAVLYPFDSAKTLRQSDPGRYRSVRHAFLELCRQPAVSPQSVTSNLEGLAFDTWRRRIPGSRAYNGLLAATIGAIPSSALYFGAYESMKRLILSISHDDATLLSRRLLIHAAAAASGNVISSAVFVPKELIKSQMQYSGSSIGRTVWKVLSEKGPLGLYSGYKATLMRNIPSACLRFVLYEELKRSWHTRNRRAQHKIGDSSPDSFSWRLFAAGALAGALASGVMTPIDVIKTRLATGTCPVDVPGCVQHVMREQGWAGLYAGAGSRMAFSGAFSAIGFVSFEAGKSWLGVSDSQPIQSRRAAAIATPRGGERRVERAFSH